MAIKDWNSHPLQTKLNCKCKALAGNVFITVPKQGTSETGQNISLRIDADATFTISVSIAYTPVPDNTIPLTNSANGRWQCCSKDGCGQCSLWYGTAVFVVALPQNPQPTVFRITIELNPCTLAARFALVQFLAEEGQCLSTFFPENPKDAFVFPFFDYQFQPVVSNCGTDFERTPTPAGIERIGTMPSFFNIQMK